jgi:hypothetical protein
LNNDRFINDNQISIIDAGKIQTQSTANVRPKNSGAIVNKGTSSARSGVIIDLYDSLTTGIYTSIISKIKITSTTIKKVNIKYKETDNGKWKDWFMSKPISAGELVVSFNAKRIGKVMIAITEAKSSSVMFNIDLYGCFYVHCKYSIS